MIMINFVGLDGNVIVNLYCQFLIPYISRLNFQTEWCQALPEYWLSALKNFGKIFFSPNDFYIYVI